MKATGIDAVYFSVTDAKRAAQFYREILEVSETTWENDHGAEFVLPDGSAFGFGVLGEWKPSGCILFSVPDVEAAAARIGGLGGKLLDDIKAFPKCRAQWCEDPDGNSFVLHQKQT
jgi:predicted enzyme related to lactoylglutathione lyase